MQQLFKHANFYKKTISPKIEYPIHDYGNQGNTFFRKRTIYFLFALLFRFYARKKYDVTFDMKVNYMETYVKGKFEEKKQNEP